ncbi:MAG: hypothetical protein ACXWB0_09180 [Sulfuricurvum sp.]
MQTIGIKDLQLNPAILTNSLQNDEYTMITKHSKPIGIALSFNDAIISDGLKTALMVDAYKKGYISLGQLGKSLDISHKKAMKMLSLMKIDVVDYDFKDDVKFLDSF